MERITNLQSRRFVALLAVVAAIVVSAVRVRADSSDPLADVSIINIIGVRAGSTAPFYVKGEPFGNAVWQPLVQPVFGDTFTMIPSASTFGGANCQPEYSRAQIQTQDGSTMVFNLVAYHCADSSPSGASTTNGLYDILGGTGKFADVTAGGGIFSLDEKADGLAFLARSGMHGGIHCVNNK
jgi:hypothetical protein